MKALSLKRANAQAGFNLIEAAIVLGIVGLIVGGIWAAAGSAYENMRQQNASKQLLSMVQGIRGFYAQNPSDTIETNITTLAGLGVLPTDMVFGDPTNRSLRDAWGSEVTITQSALDVAAFTVTFSNMKADSCRNFLSRVTNAARGSGLLVVTINGATYINLLEDSAATPTAIPPCNDKANPSFTFSLRG